MPTICIGVFVFKNPLFGKSEENKTLINTIIPRLGGFIVKIAGRSEKKPAGQEEVMKVKKNTGGKDAEKPSFAAGRTKRKKLHFFRRIYRGGMLFLFFV